MEKTDSYYFEMTRRVSLVLGPGVMEHLAKTRVIIFGLGGVGSWCAESLVRTGLANLTIVDSDIICPTNINRQAQATSLNIGESKAEETRKRLLSINPGATINAIHAVYDEHGADSFDLGSFDYVIDAIDSLKNKIHLIEQCLGIGVKLYSSMGAGSKLDPARIKTGILSNTINCPLARLVRRGLRRDGFSTDFQCVYSDELPLKHSTESCLDADSMETHEQCRRKQRVNGALVHVTAIFGFTLAGLVINDIVRKNHHESIPSKSTLER